jgi:predicted nucleotidyltransferase component of viral defense system
MIDELYYQKASLLLKILPLIGSEKDLALKGGTAINFFVRNMPRLSIDIDLCFLPLFSR